MKRKIVAGMLAVLMIISLTGCGNKNNITEDENGSIQAETESAIKVNSEDGLVDGMVTGSEDYNEEKATNLGNIQYAKIVFDSSSYSYPEEYYESMYHGKYEIILKRTDSDVKFSVNVVDTQVGEMLYNTVVSVSFEALDKLQDIIVKNEMSRLDGYYMVDSALGEGFELNVRYDSGEQIWGYAEGGYSVMPKKYWDEKWILDYVQKILESQDMSLFVAPDPVVYTVANPGWDYYYNGDLKDNTEHSYVSLVQSSAVENDIIDDADWFNYIGKDAPAWDDKCDGYYRYVLYGGDNYYPVMVDVHDIDTDELLFTLDMTNFSTPDQIAEGDERFVDEFIKDIQYKDGVFYLIMTHNTYASSAPHNAYLIALDVSKDFNVIWKTEPLTCNSNNFAIIGDSIVCGYGFTAEPDYMYVLDKYTGKRVATYKLRTGPDYFYTSEDEKVLYVRTYNMNYEYLIQ